MPDPAYIDFQIRSAGGSDNLFTQQVKELIHDYTGGVPRQINNLATACLLLADANAANRIDETILQQTLAVTVHRPGSGSFFGGHLRLLCWTLSPKNVPDPLSPLELHLSRERLPLAEFHLP